MAKAAESYVVIAQIERPDQLIEHASIVKAESALEAVTKTRESMSVGQAREATFRCAAVSKITKSKLSGLDY